MTRFDLPLRWLLRPTVRFCLRHGISFQHFLDTSRQVFLEEAKLILEKSGEMTNASRLSAMTGISRRQATESETKPGTKEGPTATMISRVIGQWSADKTFSTAGRPRPLSYEGTGSEFHRLVTTVSKDLNPYTVLKELERSGSVERSKAGIRLLSPVYISEDKLEEGFRLLGEDVADLVLSVEENVLHRKTVPNLHLRTEYDRVSAENSAKVKEWLITEGSKLHERARKFLSTLDLDIRGQRTGTSATSGKTVRVVLGSFGHVEESESTDK